MTPNRVVALATPLAAPVAGAFAAWLSQHVPGAEAEAIEETFLGVTGLVMALALQFNHNRFKWDVEEQKKSGDAAAAVAPVHASDEFESLDIDDDVLDAELDVDVDFDDEDPLALDEDVLEDEDPLDEDDELDGAADGVLLEGAAEQEARDLHSTPNASRIR